MRHQFVKHWPEFVFFGFWSAYFALFWSRAVFFDAAGNFFAGHVNIWGDWAAHFTMGTAMAERGLFIKSPFLLGANFSYPFVADFISSLFLRSGVPFITSFTFPSFCFSILLVGALYYFFQTIFSSTKMAILASSIFLLNGGLGFYYFIQDIFNSPQPLLTLLNPAHEYTRIDSLGIKWISIIDSMIIPERSFALGFSVALVALALVFRFFFTHHEKNTPQKKVWQLLVAGVCLGFLPILHTHSFLACFLFLSWWMILDLFVLAAPADRVIHFRWWVTLAGTTGLIALPLIKSFFLSNVRDHFFQIQPGWMASEFQLNWLVFTWRNWGIVPILAGLGWLLMYRGRQRSLALLLSPTFGIFLLGNLFLFQPWSWDNTKIFVWFWLGAVALTSYFLRHFLQLKRHKKLARFAKFFLLSLVLLTVTASGIIDAYRIQRISLHSYLEYTSDEMTLANWVKSNTNPNSIWLTGHPHNHWLFNLTGRQSVMAYPGWLWTQGYDYLPVQADVQAMYLGGPVAKDLLTKYRINYVVIGENERSLLRANEQFFDMNYPTSYQLGLTKIYQIRK